jgi:hypothetical protein
LEDDDPCTKTYITQIRHFTHVSRIGYVSDTGASAIRVRYAPDTPAGVSEYPDNFDTFWYASDMSMVFFQGILVDSVKNMPLILIDMLRYSSDTSLNEIYIMSFVLL